MFSSQDSLAFFLVLENDVLCLLSMMLSILIT